MTVKIIAELNCNHKGDIKFAKDLIKAAKRCGADVASFKNETINYYLIKKSMKVHIQNLGIPMAILMAYIERL